MLTPGMHPGPLASFSPSRKSLAKAEWQPSTRRVTTTSGTGFKPLNIPRTWNKRWSPDSRALYFVKSGQGIDNIWKQAISGGAPLRVTNVTSGSIASLAVSRDERVAFRHFNSISGVVLIRSER
jgi:Tol biopolymer transport system component